ncbi:MAG: pyrroloquinoline quinone biosynthesis protein PqqB [Gammaproteobacteria bacterium]|nr:MAG: pyrroloquinoline quinone biosynthesis protein PqqB [Gammaproteobacteria bacterium]
MTLNSLKTIKYLILLLAFHFNQICFAEDTQSPYLIILGIAQDAGYPQAGCYQKHCMKGWKNPTEQKSPVSLGLVDPKFKNKYLFEATPNLPQQLYKLDQNTLGLDYKLNGVFLTHAHIGHYTGLMFLGHESMGAQNIPVFAMPKMKIFLENNGPWSQLVNYKNIIIKPLKNKQTENLGSIKVTPFIVPHRDEFSETVGFRIEGPNKSALFIPDINKWSVWKQNLASMIKTVDYAFLDATFFAQGELPGRDMTKVPHPLVTETMNELKELSMQERNKVWLIHFNHTNPLLNQESKAREQVKAFGFNIAEEGLILFL